MKALAVFQASGVAEAQHRRRPGTVGYVTNNYLITNGTQVQPDQQVQHQGRPHLQRRSTASPATTDTIARTQMPGPDGPPRCPALYTNYNDLHAGQRRVPLQLGPDVEPHQVQPLLCRRQQLAPEPRSAAGIHRQLEETSSASATFRIATRTWSTSTFSNGYGGWGGQANNGSENTDLRLQRRFHLDQGQPHVQVRRHVPAEPLQRLRPPVHLRLRRLQLHGNRRRGDTNFATAGGNPFASLLLGYADSGSIDTIRFIGQQWPLLRRLLSGRLACQPEADVNLGLRWETAAAAHRPRRPLERFLARPRRIPAPAIFPGAVIYRGYRHGRVGIADAGRLLLQGFRSALRLRLSDERKDGDPRHRTRRSFGAITTVSGSTHQRGFTLT